MASTPLPELARQTLGRRNIFLLPTAEGGLFAGTLLVFLLAAINYSNGLAYAMTFLWAAAAALSLTSSQRNLLGLTLEEALPRAGFTGDSVGFRAIIANPHPTARWGIRIEGPTGGALSLDLAPHERRLIEIPHPALARGQVFPPTLRLSSHYPFGLLRAFSRRLRLTTPALSYPRPARNAPLPPGCETTDEDTDLGTIRAGGQDFADLTPFRVGDSPRHIHWKAAAAGRGLLVKQFAGQADHAVWLTLPSGLDLEAGLSFMCRQILDAERTGYRYGLRLGLLCLPPESGGRHQERCLRTLALFEDTRE